MRELKTCLLQYKLLSDTLRVSWTKVCVIGDKINSESTKEPRNRVNLLLHQSVAQNQLKSKKKSNDKKHVENEIMPITNKWSAKLTVQISSIKKRDFYAGTGTNIWEVSRMFLCRYGTMIDMEWIILSMNRWNRLIDLSSHRSHYTCLCSRSLLWLRIDLILILP